MVVFIENVNGHGVVGRPQIKKVLSPWRRLMSQPLLPWECVRAYGRPLSKMALGQAVRFQRRFQVGLSWGHLCTQLCLQELFQEADVMALTEAEGFFV